MGRGDALHSDPRMKAYFPKITELASLDWMLGSAVLSKTVKARAGLCHARNKGELQWLAWS
jgi:hypothetical protein